MRENENGDLILDDGRVVPEKERMRAEVWSRPVGFLRPTENYNPGKQAEFNDRKNYVVDTK